MKLVPPKTAKYRRAGGWRVRYWPQAVTAGEVTAVSCKRASNSKNPIRNTAWLIAASNTRPGHVKAEQGHKSQTRAERKKINLAQANKPPAAQKHTACRAIGNKAED